MGIPRVFITAGTFVGGSLLERLVIAGAQPNVIGFFLARLG